MADIMDPLFSSQIILWLHKLPENNEAHQPEMPLTPPISLSPKRRKRSENDDDDDDQETTPIPATRAEPRRLAPIPLRFQQAASAYSSSTTSQSRTSSRTSTRSRATSPVKRTVNLEFLSKPVHFEEPGDDLDAQLTDDAARELLSRITRITRWKTEFLPAEACDIIQANVPDGKNWPSQWFRPKGDQNKDEDGEKKLAAQIQFAALSEIVFETKASIKRIRHELAWNNAVHWPLLKLATRSVSGWGGGGVICEPTMSAGIANMWLPGMANSQAQEQNGVAGGKIVDCVLTLDLHNRRPSDAPLREAIVRLIRDQPPNVQSINQTNYHPLVFNPIGVSIETKCNTGAAKGNVQLGIWTAAWHHRVQNLVQSPVNIALPLLLCHEHAWKLYFACDRGHEIEIIGPITIGSTDTLDSAYSLFAVLVEICKWVEGPYRTWWETILGVAKDSSGGPGGDSGA
ncbi:hypothetical protein RB601_003667 [Gaeumannomyces tritici]